MQRLVAPILFSFVLMLLGVPDGNLLGAAATKEGIQDKPAEISPATERSNPVKSTAESESEEKSETPAEEKGSEDKEPEDEAKADAKSEDEASAEESEEKPDKDKEDTEKKPKPFKVKADKLRVEINLDGIFVADEMEEIVLRPEVWTRFKILEVIEHGKAVKKGDVLIRFDDEKLEQDLEKEALNQSVGQLDLMQAEEELPRVRRLQELAFEEAERRRDQTQADYDYYHETDRPFAVQIANFRYKSAAEQLATAKEELEQLTQMYEADEITEETEEIVLRRQQFAVETAELVLKINKENRDYTLNVALPRTDKFYETALEETKLAYEQAKTALDLGKTRKNYDMEKKRKERAESIERHGKLLSDKALMELRAPCDGVVYYGKCTNGKWSQIASLQAKLKPFGTAAVNSVLMTIVKPKALHVEARLSEKELPDVKPDQQVTILPTANAELEMKGEIARIDAIPGAANKFDVNIDVELSDAPAWLVAGMTCDAKVLVYENKQALVVPLALVATDEDDDKQKYVMLLDKEEDEPVRRNVTLGRKQGKNVEVLKGLKAGDQIVKEEKKDDEE